MKRLPGELGGYLGGERIAATRNRKYKCPPPACPRKGKAADLFEA